jgi:hypothetical protein
VGTQPLVSPSFPVVIECFQIVGAPPCCRRDWTESHAVGFNAAQAAAMLVLICWLQATVLPLLCFGGFVAAVMAAIVLAADGGCWGPEP